MSVKVCSPFVTPSQTSPKLGLNNNKKRPFSLLRTPTKTSAETKFIFPAVSPRPVSSHRAAEQNLVMIGTASAGSTSLGSAVSRVAAAVADPPVRPPMVVALTFDPLTAYELPALVVCIAAPCTVSCTESVTADRISLATADIGVHKSIAKIKSFFIIPFG